MKALVLSGGGTNGAFEVGALRHLLFDLQKPYDLICGVSVGALNGAFLAQYNKGEERQAYKDLRKLWDTIETKSIYKKWYWGLLWYLPILWKHSIYDSTPLHELVKTNLDATEIKESDKQLRVMGVNYNTKERSIWTDDDPEIIRGVLASSSFPLFFLPIHTKNFVHTDGGIRDITPLSVAIRAGATEIDIIVCYPDKLEREKEVKLKIWNQAPMMLDIVFNEIGRNDLRMTNMYNKMVQANIAPKGKRYIKTRLIQPERNLGDSLDGSPEKNQKLFEIGYERAIKAGIQG